MPTRKEQAFAAYDKAVVQGRAARDTMVAAAAQDLEQAKAKAFELLVAAMQQVREAYDVEIILAHTSHAEAAAQAAQAFDDAVAPARQALDEAMLVEEDAPKHAKAARTAAAATLSAVQAEPVPVAAPQSDLAAILAQAAPAIDIAEQELPGDVGALDERAIEGLPGDVSLAQDIGPKPSGVLLELLGVAAHAHTPFAVQLCHRRLLFGI